MSEQTTPETESDEIIYLIGWIVIESTGRFSTGSTIINRSGPIRNQEDVLGVIEFIREHLGEPNVSVMGFSRFED